MTEAEIARRMHPGEGAPSYWDGERQAIVRCGPWPRSGTIAEYSAAADRAEREARRAHDLIDRFTARFGLRDRPYDPAAAQQVIRANARLHRARDISRQRDERLRLLIGEAGGSA